MAFSFFAFRRWSRNLSVRAGFYCLAAIGAALIAVIFAPYVPESWAELLGGEAVDHILTILASSMLAVVTFSLSTLISTYGVLAGGAPPRATALVIQDSRAQSALSAFLGAFIFSVVSLVALSTKYYGSKGRVILFGITIFVLAMVIYTIIRWIGQLSESGRLSNIIDRVEAEAEAALNRQSNFFSWEKNALPFEAIGNPVFSKKSGFVQSVNFHALSILAEHWGSRISVLATPGTFVHPFCALATVEGLALSEQQVKELLEKFYIGNSRDFTDDPRFGFIVLSEIASRALSPGINDPGTAIHVLSSITRLAVTARNAGAEKEVPSSNRVSVKPVMAIDLFDDAFRAIARDAAGNCEVMIFLRKALAALAHFPEFETAAKSHLESSLKRAKEAEPYREDLQRIEAAGI